MVRLAPPGWNCQVEGCRKRNKATAALCWNHYQRQRRWGDPLGSRPEPPPCIVKGCGQKHEAKGYCKHHYYRLYDGLPLEPADLRPPFRTCSVEGCDREHAAKGYCSIHYARYRKGQPVDGVVSLRDGKSLRLGNTCTVVGCGRRSAYTYLCHKHMQRSRAREKQRASLPQ